MADRGGSDSFIKTTTTRELRCALNDEEVAARAYECMQKLAEIDRLSDARKAAAAEFKAQLDELRGDMRTLAREVREKAVMRDVNVEEWIHPADGYAEQVRTDTGEVLLKRPLEPHEKQGNLFPLRLARTGSDVQVEVRAEGGFGDPPPRDEKPKRKRGRKRNAELGEDDDA